MVRPMCSAPLIGSIKLLTTYVCSVGNTLYVYVFLSVMVVIGFGSVAVYCYHRRRIQRFVDHDNMNNNMQRHSLVDR